MLQGPEISYSNRKESPTLKSTGVFTYSLLEIAIKISQVLGANAEQIVNTILKIICHSMFYIIQLFQNQMQR